MPFLRLEDILRPTSTPAQANLMSWFYSTFNIGGKVAHRTIINVEPLFFMGSIVATEFLVYAVTKLYICYSLSVGSYISYSPSISWFDIYDENNADYFRASNSALVYDSVNAVPKYIDNAMFFYNLYFSRLMNYNTEKIIFNGYRVTLN